MAAVFAPLRSGQRLGLGGAPLGNLFQAISDSAAHAVLAAAWADGCRSFDTAPHYGQGLSEHRVGRLLREHPGADFGLSTKVGRLLHPDAGAPADQNGYVQCLPFRQTWDFSGAGVQRSLLDSLQRLGLARVDTVYLHDCDAGTHGAAYPQVLEQVVQQALPALRELRQQGLVRHLGLGVNDVQVCLDVLQRTELDTLLLAGRYSLLDHAALPQLLPLCVQQGVRIALGGVFNSGILATGVRGVAVPRFNYAAAPAAWVERVARIEALCENFEVPLRAAALQFPLAHPAIAIVMVGAQTVAQWSDAVAMMAHPIPPGFWQALKAAGLLGPETPVPA